MRQLEVHPSRLLVALVLRPWLLIHCMHLRDFRGKEDAHRRQ